MGLKELMVGLVARSHQGATLHCATNCRRCPFGRTKARPYIVAVAAWWQHITTPCGRVSYSVVAAYNNTLWAMALQGVVVILLMGD
ncbi:MAG: hypothetical protein U0L43_09625 [Muribaculaceae bacterium]|nr:hypothetical protein [Muribaculaceae bacterium]